MRKFVLALAAVSTLAVVTPAMAGGVGVRVGPFGAGVGPSYDDGWRYRHRGYGYEGDRGYGYAGDCRVTRERIVTPSGRVIVRTHKVCD